MADWYILDDNKNPVKCDDYDTVHCWVKCLPESEHSGMGCKVDYWTNGDVTVSTVFLSMDHSWNTGPPLVFESMVFPEGIEEKCERYSTWDEAKAGHAKMVLEIQAEGNA